MTKKSNQDPVVEGQEIIREDDSTTVDTNAGDDAQQGTIANEKGLTDDRAAQSKAKKE